MSDFLSPGAVIMLPLAILIDLIGIVLIFFGLDDFWTTDIIAFIFIGSWTYFRSQMKGKEPAEMPSVDSFQTKKGLQKERKLKRTAKYMKPQKADRAMKSAKRMKWLKPLTFLGELVPYLGVLPMWTIMVYFELKDS